MVALEATTTNHLWRVTFNYIISFKDIVAPNGCLLTRLWWSALCTHETIECHTKNVKLFTNRLVRSVTCVETSTCHVAFWLAAQVSVHHGPNFSVCKHLISSKLYTIRHRVPLFGILWALCCWLNWPNHVTDCKDLRRYCWITTVTNSGPCCQSADRFVLDNIQQPLALKLAHIWLIDYEHQTSDECHTTWTLRL